MSSLVILDTSVLVDDVRTGVHAHRMQRLNGILRFSSVVLAELWCGSRSRADQAWLAELEQGRPILAPTTANWLESGRILARMHKDRGFELPQLRDLHFDVLIALTARTHGARLITSNRADFDLIRKYKPFELEIWPST